MHGIQSPWTYRRSDKKRVIITLFTHTWNQMSCYEIYYLLWPTEHKIKHNNIIKKHANLQTCPLSLNFCGKSSCPSDKSSPLRTSWGLFHRDSYLWEVSNETIIWRPIGVMGKYRRYYSHFSYPKRKFNIPTHPLTCLPKFHLLLHFIL